MDDIDLAPVFIIHMLLSFFLSCFHSFFVSLFLSLVNGYHKVIFLFIHLFLNYLYLIKFSHLFSPGEMIVFLSKIVPNYHQSLNTDLIN